MNRILAAAGIVLVCIVMLGPKVAVPPYDDVHRDDTSETGVHRKKRIQVVVDELAHPRGYSAFVLRAADHDPDVESDLPASRTMFYVQRNRSVWWRKIRFAGGSDSFDTYVGDGEFVVELWSRRRDPVSGNWLYSLAAFERVPANQQDHAVSLD